MNPGVFQADLHLDVVAAQQLQQEANTGLLQQQQQQQQQSGSATAGITVPMGNLNVTSVLPAPISSNITPPTDDSAQQLARDRYVATDLVLTFLGST